MSKDKLLKFRMGSFKIIGIVCSGNELVHDVRNDALMAGCDTMVYKNELFDGID